MLAKLRDEIVTRFKTQEGAVWVLWWFTGARTVSYFVERPTVLSHLIDRLEADWLSPLLWGLAWLLLTFAAFSRSEWMLTVAMGVSTGVVFLWGILFLWSDPIEFFARGSVYLALCGLVVWGTVRTVLTEKEDGDAVGVSADD